MTRSGFGEVSNLLLRRSTDGFYEDIAELYRLASPGHTIKSAIGNPLGDGYPMIFIARYNDGTERGRPLVYIPPRQIQEEGVLPFEEVGTPLGLRIPGQIVGVEWFDSNGDEKQDLLIAMEDGAIYLFINETREVTTCE